MKENIAKWVSIISIISAVTFTLIYFTDLRNTATVQYVLHGFRPSIKLTELEKQLSTVEKIEPPQEVHRLYDYLELVYTLQEEERTGFYFEPLTEKQKTHAFSHRMPGQHFFWALPKKPIPNNHKLKIGLTERDVNGNIIRSYGHQVYQGEKWIYRGTPEEIGKLFVYEQVLLNNKEEVVDRLLLPVYTPLKKVVASLSISKNRIKSGEEIEYSITNTGIDLWETSPSYQLLKWENNQWMQVEEIWKQPIFEKKYYPAVATIVAPPPGESHVGIINTDYLPIGRYKMVKHVTFIHQSRNQSIQPIFGVEFEIEN